MYIYEMIYLGKIHNKFINVKEEEDQLTLDWLIATSQTILYTWKVSFNKDFKWKNKDIFYNYKSILPNKINIVDKGCL